MKKGTKIVYYDPEQHQEAVGVIASQRSDGKYVVVRVDRTHLEIPPESIKQVLIILVDLFFIIKSLFSKKARRLRKEHQAIEQLLIDTQRLNTEL